MNWMATANTIFKCSLGRLRGRVMSIYTLSFIGICQSEASKSGSSASITVRARQCSSARHSRCMCGFILLTKLKLIAQAQEAIAEAS